MQKFVNKQLVCKTLISPSLSYKSLNNKPVMKFRLEKVISINVFNLFLTQIKLAASRHLHWHLGFLESLELFDGLSTLNFISFIYHNIL